MNKIAHVVATGEYSGAEKIVIEICQYLKDDYDFVYICRPGGIEEYLKVKKIRYILYNSTKELISILRKSDFDIVHAHDYTTSVLSGFFFKGRVISHIHNNTPFAKSFNLKSLMFYISSKNIEKILCVSNSIVDEMYFKEKLIDKLTVSYNWVNKDERYWSEEVDKDIDILFVGRFTEQKNPMLFLDVIHDIKKSGFDNLKVKMIGRGELKNNILDYIKDNKLESNIEVLDFTKEPHKYMKKAKVFFVPSKWEGFGLVFLEAMINKCAVVATPVGGIREIFKDNLGNFSNDRSELIKIIEKMLRDDKSREKDISNNEYILDRFDMKTNINKIKQYYENVI